MKQVRLIKMCLNETFSRVRADKHLSAMLPVKNGLKQGDALSPLLFNLAVEYDFRSAQVNQNGLTNGTNQRLVYVRNICGVEVCIL